MTRINCISPKHLHQLHLVAEYRELPRIFPLVQGAVSRGEKPADARNPKTYRMGTGHVRFFYPRLQWLANRHDALCDEMQERGIVTNLEGFYWEHSWRVSPAGFGGVRTTPAIPREWWGDWEPDNAAVHANLVRLRERLPGHYDALEELASCLVQ